MVTLQKQANQVFFEIPPGTDAEPPFYYGEETYIVLTELSLMSDVKGITEVVIRATESGVETERVIATFGPGAYDTKHVYVNIIRQDRVVIGVRGAAPVKIIGYEYPIPDDAKAALRTVYNPPPVLHFVPSGNSERTTPEQVENERLIGDYENITFQGLSDDSLSLPSPNSYGPPHVNVSTQTVAQKSSGKQKRQIAHQTSSVNTQTDTSERAILISVHTQTLPLRLVRVRIIPLNSYKFGAYTQNGAMDRRCAMLWAWIKHMSQVPDNQQVDLVKETTLEGKEVTYTMNPHVNILQAFIEVFADIRQNVHWEAMRRSLTGYGPKQCKRAFFANKCTH